VPRGDTLVVSADISDMGAPPPRHRRPLCIGALAASVTVLVVEIFENGGDVALEEGARHAAYCIVDAAQESPGGVYIHVCMCVFVYVIIIYICIV